MPDGNKPVPNPGSPEAGDLGCTCPVLDNAHGRGRRDGEFWISGDCPIHVLAGEAAPVSGQDGTADA